MTRPDRTHRSAALLEEARQAQGHQHYRRSIRIYESLIAADAADPLPHHRLGELLLRRGEVKKGREALLRAMELYEARGERAKASALRRMASAAPPSGPA